MFQIIAKDKNSSARAGILETPSGRKLETPAYAIVGTHAEIRCINPDEAKKAGVKLVIANTYHLWKNLGENLSSFEGLHSRMGLEDAVIMTDSGGFQVFSLGFAREHKTGKITGEGFEDRTKNKGDKKDNLVKITGKGVYFMDGDKKSFLGPELSIRIQEKLGADIIFAFDECTSPLHGYWYNWRALRRTHKWAKECLHKKISDQMLYGIVQGGSFEKLRKKSAKFIGSLPFDGFAIGGAFGKEEMNKVIEWSIPYLPENRPRHMLGVGRIEDILNGIERGMDTFDCVIPTREGRHGAIWTSNGRIDLKKAKHINSDVPLEKGCKCLACLDGITRGKLREMFKEKNLVAGQLATTHNIFFFNHFMEEIMRSIKAGNFKEFATEAREKLTGNNE